MLSGIQPERTEEPDCFVLAHCGQFYGPRSPRPWFRALAHLRSANPQLAARTRFLSVGCESHDGEPIVRIAQQEGVADLLRVFPHRSHGESLALARAGLLNDRRHTSTVPGDLDAAAGYSGAAHYVTAPAVTDRGVITGSGLASVDFAREIFAMLEVFNTADQALWFDMYKSGQLPNTAV